SAFGLAKVTVLDLSHNIINEIRDNVLGNLTYTQYLDLSNNNIGTLKTGFLAPAKNITVLKMRKNEMSSFPFSEVEAYSGLQLLDISENELGDYEPAVLRLVEKGVEVYLAGNPLDCNCKLRPLIRWIADEAVNNTWDSVTCASPPSLVNRTFMSLRQE